MTTEARPPVGVLLAAIGALCIAPLPLPYGYYELLRIFIFCVGAYLAVRSHQSDREGWAWAFGALALIYNPIVKIHLGRELWSAVNIGTAAFLAWHLLAVAKAGRPPMKG